MEPGEALEKLRNLCDTFNRPDLQPIEAGLVADRIVELFQGLDHSIVHNGVLPEGWSHAAGNASSTI